MILLIGPFAFVIFLACCALLLAGHYSRLGRPKRVRPVRRQAPMLQQGTPPVWIEGYQRRNGTWVRGYWKRG